ncbi:MAG: Mg2+ transport system protein MgtC [Candidatus Methanohalarchaeum thermophilum]|uniref:Mg2+ transport system protein MgtC n=1 Tax=Methanohalarchaeum thermophilum TaxID=1903181 RepID=A0A1Q6DY04_METT1|nr:MAG: Mg2+ transport system protein MgtC [Candidatus Methanohalarchaeum thermophilum]
MILFFEEGSFLALAFQIFVAFGLGALIGLEREKSESGGNFAGSRTFPLFALYGALVQTFFPSMLVVAVLSLILPLSLAYSAKIITENDIGLTTLTTALVVVILGAVACYSEEGTMIAIVVGGLITVLLSAKVTLHSFAKNMSQEEKEAIIKFVIVILVILPLLPDRELEALYGLNPHFVWLMVVFVTGLSFCAYILGKLYGPSKGLVATGVLGGFVSSTATAVSMAGRTKESPSLYKISAFSVIIASIVMFPRALVEVTVINPTLVPYVAIPMAAMMLIATFLLLLVYLKSSFDGVIEHEVKNPFRLKTALFFGGIFAIVLLASRSANSFLGAAGVYSTALISGLADVDAITLSLAKLTVEGTINHQVAATGIIIAAISNTLVKATLAWVLGTKKLGKLVTTILGAASIVGLIIVLLL